MDVFLGPEGKIGSRRGDFMVLGFSGGKEILRVVVFSLTDRESPFFTHSASEEIRQ